MKIEKISENQIKLTLTKADLDQHNIRLEELVKPSEKTQELFKTIMEKAFDECGFEVDDKPLMVEATPVSVDGLMIIITKIPDKESHKEKMELLAQNKELRRYRRKDVAPLPAAGSDSENVTLYIFEKLDDVIDASIRIEDKIESVNMVFKFDDKYYLCIQEDLKDEVLSELNEYGEKSSSSILSKYYLMEHGETIVKTPAIKILAESFK